MTLRQKSLKKNDDDIARELSESLPVLSNSLTRMLDELGNVKEMMSEIKTKLAEYHDAIYDPDDGLYARIKKIESDKNHVTATIEKKLSDFNEFKIQIEEDLSVFKDKTDTKSIEIFEANVQKTRDIERLIEDYNTRMVLLERWQENALSIVKKTLYALASLTSGVLIKIIYDIIVKL